MFDDKVKEVMKTSSERSLIKCQKIWNLTSRDKTFPASQKKLPVSNSQTVVLDDLTLKIGDTEILVDSGADITSDSKIR